MDLPLTDFQCGEQPKWYIQIVSFALVLYWERWLGRTKRFTAASTWDLIVNAIKSIYARLRGKHHEPTKP